MAQFYMHKIFNMFGVFLISETKVTILVELKGHITDKCNLYKSCLTIDSYLFCCLSL
jgi:hypothetical protein